MQASEAEFVQMIKDPADLERYKDSRKSWLNAMAMQSLGPVYKSMSDMENIRHSGVKDKLKAKYGSTNETIVPGFGEMRPEQVKKEVEGLTAEMLKYAREGNMRAVAEYIKKLQPFVDTAQKTSVTESIDKALRTAKRNAV